MSMPTTDTAADAMKIQRQPTFSRHQAPEQRGEARAAPRPHRPQADRALAPGPVPVRLHRAPDSPA